MRERSALGRAELDQQTAVLLPARETLYTIGATNITTVVGINVALAVNAASINSAANAFAYQQLAIWQR